MLNTAKFIATSTLALALAACGSAKDASKSNFSKAIQAYLDTQHGLCAGLPARELPFTLGNADMLTQRNKKQADALVAAGLLAARDTEVKAMFGDAMLPATEYQVTDAGKKYLVAGVATSSLTRQDAFCTGKYAVVEVDTFTEPSDTMMGVKLSQVNFRYKLQGAADWANAETVRAAYREFAERSQGDIPGKAALILTNDGWMHEQLFERRATRS